MTKESKLVVSAKAGDRAALETLFRQNQDDLYRLSLRLMWSDKALAEDLAQETMLAAIEGLGSFRGTATFRTWLFSIAFNIYRGHLRRSKLTREKSATFREIATESVGADEVAAEAQKHDLMQRAFSMIASGQREAVYLRDILGCTYSEAATILGVSLSSVKNRVHHGRRNMTSAILTLTNESCGLAEKV